jgi:hypothetical protein
MTVVYSSQLGRLFKTNAEPENFMFPPFVVAVARPDK